MELFRHKSESDQAPVVPAPEAPRSGVYRAVRNAALLAGLLAQPACLVEFPAHKGGCSERGEGEAVGCEGETALCRPNLQDVNSLVCYETREYCDYIISKNLSDEACPGYDALVGSDGEAVDTGSVLDSGVTPVDGSIPVVDARVDLDSQSTPDAVVPTPDAAVPTPDATGPVVDAEAPVVDAVVQLPDAATPALDAVVPTPDAVVPTPDAVVPTPDAVVPVADAVAPTPDAVVPVDAVVPDPDAAELPLDEGLTPPIEDAAVDASLDAAVDAAVDAAPVAPCVITIEDVISNGPVPEELQLFCSEGDDHQIDLPERRIVFGPGNLCGVADMPTAWILMDRTQAAVFRAVGDDCDGVRIDFGPRNEVPTDLPPLNDNWIENFSNQSLSVNGADVGAGSAVVRFHREPQNP